MNHKHRAGLSGNPAKRAEAERRIAVGSPAEITWRDWVGGARLRTLPLAVAPIAAAAGIAHMLQSFSLTLTLLAFGVAVLLQIGVNFANDYSDGIRGTDAYRVGPQRLTGSGLVNPKKVLATALVFFGLAAVCGLIAIVLSGRWWLLLIGVAAILAAWFYTGGKRPYGYMGLGEVFVFIFFGLVATVATVWLQSDLIAQEPWIAGAGVGLLAVAVLVANNTRDIPTDRAAGKRTVSVMLGPTGSRVLYLVCALLPFVVPIVYIAVYPTMVLVFFALLLVVPAAVIMLWGKTPRELVLALMLTSLGGLAYGALLGVAFAF